MEEVTVKVFLTTSQDEMGKFRGVVQAFPDIWDGLVLDVGCRSGNLKRAIVDRSGMRYWGLDLSPAADVIGNLETGLPFRNASFDAVIAMDVLEHVDNIYKAFDELCRVASNYVLIVLPNAYELPCRIKFLLGQRLSGKYGLPLTPPNDRHRWLFSLREAKAFTGAMGERHRFEVMAEGYLVGPRRGFAVGRLMISLFPNLLSPWYVALLHRKEVME
jgi:SAM-dependent methyltransferase